MKIVECEQRSVEWMQARAGIPTASEFDQILTPKLKPREGKTIETYLAKKLAEWWLGGPLADFNTFDMDQGNILESEAIPWYNLEYSAQIQRIGFITTDDGVAGCSPDGLLEDGGIEIKCPRIHTHFGYVLAGQLPEEYAAQVYGSLWVTGLPQWTFVSYHRKCPNLVIPIESDAGKMGLLQDAMDNFITKFEQAKAKLIEINGGPPPRFTIKPKPAPEPPKEEYLDLIP